VRGLRLARAAELLTLTSLSIKEIAVQVGYPRTRDLYPAFDERYGMTPGGWRRRTRADRKRKDVT
jgi:transcriptional regulator GlxA family with amidase domain